MNRGRGHTLVELMAVLAIASCLLALAAPDLRGLVRRQQLKAASGDLFAAVNLARAQALARGHKVVVVPRDPLGSDWRTGWTVFADRDGDGAAGPGDEVIAEHGPLAPGIEVAFAFTTSAPPWYIAYNGAGRGCGRTNGAAARWGTLSLFHGGAIRRITINMLGRARLCDPARDASCTGPAAPP
jgi:type IV fimbrial biogenesis protein FimT